VNRWLWRWNRSVEIERGLQLGLPELAYLDIALAVVDAANLFLFFGRKAGFGNVKTNRAAQPLQQMNLQTCEIFATSCHTL
jgi:hypothetical protein